MSEAVIVDYQIGDVVRVLSGTVVKDFEGKEIQLPQGIEGTIVEVAESEFQLEIECIVENEIAVAILSDDQVELVWRERA